MSSGLASVDLVEILFTLFWVFFIGLVLVVQTSAILARSSSSGSPSVRYWTTKYWRVSRSGSTGVRKRSGRSSRPSSRNVPAVVWRTALPSEASAEYEGPHSNGQT